MKSSRVVGHPAVLPDVVADLDRPGLEVPLRTSDNPVHIDGRALPSLRVVGRGTESGAARDAFLGDVVRRRLTPMRGIDGLGQDVLLRARDPAGRDHNAGHWHAVAGGEVALVHNEDQYRQYAAEPLGQLGELGHRQ